MIEQVGIMSVTSDSHNLFVNKQLNLAHKNKQKFHTLYDNLDKIEFSNTYEDYKRKLECYLEISYNCSALISLLVLIKSELNTYLRNNNNLGLVSRIDIASKYLSDDLTSYKSISYAMTDQVKSLRELISIKFPNERYNII